MAKQFNLLDQLLKGIPRKDKQGQRKALQSWLRTLTPAERTDLIAKVKAAPASQTERSSLGALSEGAIPMSMKQAMSQGEEILGLEPTAQGSVAELTFQQFPEMGWIDMVPAERVMFGNRNLFDKIQANTRQAFKDVGFSDAQAKTIWTRFFHDEVAQLEPEHIKALGLDYTSTTKELDKKARKVLLRKLSVLPEMNKVLMAKEDIGATARKAKDLGVISGVRRRTGTLSTRDMNKLVKVMDVASGQGQAELYYASMKKSVSGKSRGQRAEAGARYVARLRAKGVPVAEEIIGQTLLHGRSPKVAQIEATGRALAREMDEARAMTGASRVAQRGVAPFFETAQQRLDAMLARVSGQRAELGELEGIASTRERWTRARQGQLTDELLGLAGGGRPALTPSTGAAGQDVLEMLGLSGARELTASEALAAAAAGGPAAPAAQATEAAADAAGAAGLSRRKLIQYLLGRDIPRATAKRFAEQLERGPRTSGAMAAKVAAELKPRMGLLPTTVSEAIDPLRRGTIKGLTPGLSKAVRGARGPLGAAGRAAAGLGPVGFLLFEGLMGRPGDILAKMGMNPEFDQQMAAMRAQRRSADQIIAETQAISDAQARLARANPATVEAASRGLTTGLLPRLTPNETYLGLPQPSAADSSQAQQLLAQLLAGAA